MKKKIVLAAAFILVLVCVSVAGASNTIRLVVNGREIFPDVPPQIINGRIIVPVRFIAEELEAKVSYNSVTQTVNVQWPDNVLAGLGLIDLMNENP